MTDFSLGAQGNPLVPAEVDAEGSGISHYIVKLGDSADAAAGQLEIIHQVSSPCTILVYCKSRIYNSNRGA